MGSPTAVVAQLGVALRRELGCDAGAVEAAAEALADRLTRAGSKHRGAAALVTEQVPARALRALPGWTTRESEPSLPPCPEAGASSGVRRTSSNTSKGVASDVYPGRYDRVAERRRAVALARRYREFEGLSIAEIARHLGRSPATIKAYFYDRSNANKRPTDSPTGSGPRRGAVRTAVTVSLLIGRSFLSARERGFLTLTEYREHLVARLREKPSATGRDRFARLVR